MINRSDAFFIIAIVALFLILLKQCNEIKVNNALNEAAQDTLVKYRDKEERQVTRITSLMGSVSELHKLNSSKDSTLRRLQQLVDRKTINATVISNVTAGNVSMGSRIIKHDTVRSDSLIEVFPVYSDSAFTKWEKFKVIASHDSIQINYKVFNEFDITQRQESNGFLKPKKTIITVRNNNPHTETLDLKNFTVKPPKQNKGVWAGAGVLAGIIGTLIFLH